MRIRQLVFAVVMGAIPVVAIPLLGEAVIRLTVPQDMSGTWFVGGPRGLLLNRAGGTARHQLGERTVVYRFNSLHQRGGEPVRGVPKVLVLGDSFAFGWLLDEEYAFAGQLQSHADRDLGPNRVQFLNAATGGWGAASYVAYLEAFGEIVDPAAVVIFVNATDFRRATKSGLYAARAPQSLDLDAIDLGPRFSPIRSWVRQTAAYEWVLDNFHLVHFLRKLMLGGLPAVSAHAPMTETEETEAPVSHSNAADKRLGHALLRRARAWTRDRAIDLFVITTYHPAYSDDAYVWLDAVAAAEGLPFLRLQERLATRLGDGAWGMLIAGDPHPDKEISIAASDVAWKWLRPRLEKTLGK